MEDLLPAEIEEAQKKIVVGRFQIISAMGEIFNHVDKGLPMWSGQGDRSVSIEVTFLAPFGTPPVVNLGIVGVDSSHDQNLRLWLLARNITQKGFVLELSTWSDTHIARAAVSWSAFGPVPTSTAP